MYKSKNNYNIVNIKISDKQTDKTKRILYR